MTAHTEAYASKIVVADTLGKLRARAITITAVARTRPIDSAAAYYRATGAASPSGQSPKDHRWALKSATYRRQTAYLLIVYAQYRAQFEAQADAHGLAFIIAYKNYLRTFADPKSGSALISIERFNLIVGTGYSLGWRGIKSGGASKFVQDNVKLLKCSKCDSPHLVEAHRLSYKCDVCPTPE